MRRALHLQHHHHTGKLLAHKHTSYRGLLIIVALFGITLTLLYRAVQADELVTTAKVSAVLPTHPATITLPTNNAILLTMPTAITGTCEYIDPASVVELYSDSEFIGSTTCSTAGTYSFYITLRAGTHRLLVRTVNITNDYGPDSAELTITYAPTDASQISTSPSNDSESNAKSSNTTQTLIPDQIATGGLIIRSQYSYIVYGPAKDAEWAGYFEGGTGPYKVTIDWGDGTSSSHSDVGSDRQSFRHHYDNYTSYFMTVTMTDSTGASLRHQFAVVTPYVDTTMTTTATTSHSWFDKEKQTITFIAYGTIATLASLTVLMMIHTPHPFLEPRRLTPAGHRPRKGKHR